MKPEDRERFWKAVDSGENPLLSAMSSVVEKWGLPAVIMCLGDIANVLSEDAVDADNLTPNQRGLVIILVGIRVKSEKSMGILLFGIS